LDFILYNLPKAKGGYTIMDLSNLKQNHKKLISYMEEKEYSKSYIHAVQIEIDRILLHEKGNPWDSYQDIYRDYEASPHSKRSLLCKATFIGLIAHFDLEGLYPGGHQWHTLWHRGVYTRLLPEFKGLVDHYKAAADILEIRKVTIKRNLSTISNFLYALQVMGCGSLTDVNEKYVLRIFSDDGKNPSKSAGHKNTISRILRSCSGYSDDCLTIASFLPPIHNKRKNIQYVTADEATTLRAYADKGLMPLRDKAILFLLLYTGLRACDIAGITFNSIDWETEKFHVIQQKTKIPLELPLSPLVGNAIFDYITEERPDSKEMHIFLTKSKPYPPLTTKGFWSVLHDIMAKAGIRQKPGDRQGSHIFRHHVATSMLGKGVPTPVISHALGHTALDSIEPYLHADLTHLKECSISIEKYPVREEVFVL